MKEKNYIENQGQHSFLTAGYLGLRAAGAISGGAYGGTALVSILSSLSILTSISGPGAIVAYGLGGLLGGVLAEYIAMKFGANMKPNDYWKTEHHAF